MARLIAILIFYFLINLAIINSFILWQVNKRNRNLDQLTFRIALARLLIDGYFSRKGKGRPARSQAKKCDVRLASVENPVPKMVSNYRRSAPVGLGSLDLLFFCRPYRSRLPSSLVLLTPLSVSAPFISCSSDAPIGLGSLHLLFF
ncbi:piggyBac transposable element-derived protein 4 [Trichonephila clavipes]|nr:piggyBac transposable element-derived protein 4 [Trichonephila clavipes]